MVDGRKSLITYNGKRVVTITMVSLEISTCYETHMLSNDGR